VLGGVPYVGPDLHAVDDDDDVRRCLKGATYPSCLRACLEYLDDTFGSKLISVAGEKWRLDNLYVYLVGVTGCAFRLDWRSGWRLDNAAIFHMSDDAGAPFRRAQWALGYPQEPLAHKGKQDEAAFRRLVVEGLHGKGLPLLAHGVIGPPESSLITGYDEGVDVLLGWSYFQGRPGTPVGWWGNLNRDGVVEWNAEPEVEFEPSGCYRKRNWFRHTADVSYLAPKQQPPPRGEVYRDALSWALQVVRTPVTRRTMHNGLAAYGAWAAALQRDGDFPAGNVDVLRDRYMVHTGAVRVVAEGRWYAARFLEQIAKDEPQMANDLLAAAACHEAEHNLMWEVWHLVGYEADSPLMWHDWTFTRVDQLDVYAQRLAGSEVRNQIASLVLQAKAKDAEAIGHIERAPKEKANTL
jgi:hypothetical protein